MVSCKAFACGRVSRGDRSVAGKLKKNLAESRASGTERRGKGRSLCGESLHMPLDGYIVERIW